MFNMHIWCVYYVLPLLPYYGK